MIMLDCSLRTQVLGLPAEYSIALPDCAKEGKKLPAILLLHGLGGSADDWKYGARLDILTERFKAAFVMPSSRRSCFQDMSSGPRWNTWLKDGLMPAIRQHTGQGGKTAVIGIGTGALGVYALAMADPSVTGAVIDPAEDTPFERNADAWPLASEWEGVFGGKQPIWEKGLPDASEGLILISQGSAGRIPARGWKAEACEASAALERAVEYCLGRLETEETL